MKSSPNTEASIWQIRRALDAGEYTASELVQAYLKRIKAVDQTGPRIQSVIEVNRDAVVAAENRDRASKGARRRLHGIPVLLKDNIATRDKMETTAGSLALVGSKVPRDAHIVTLLRDEGCVLLGKTNLSEWANFRSTRSISGWSARGRQTRNPHVLDRNTRGSSSGSAAAVAAGLCAVAVGTETDGSIVSPASVCGIVGIKPTLGLVSRSGIIPIAHSQDTAGPMARSVADAAALLTVLAGFDPRDPATAPMRDRKLLDYTNFCRPDSLKGRRLGFARALFPSHPEIVRIFDTACAVLRTQGARVVEIQMPTNGQFDAAELEVLLYEFKHDLNAYLAELESSPVRSLRDIIRFNERNAWKETPYFGQELLVMAQAKGDLSAPAYRRARAQCVRESQREGIDRAMEKHGLDALICPTNGPAWPIDPVNTDRYTGGCSTFAAVAGYPHITVPMGRIQELPVGLSFFAGAFQEPTIIALAYAYEQATKHYRAPKFLPTLPVS